MEQPAPILVRGTCACGKRYRIRNAQAGITVMCPNCRRPIPITDADMRAAATDARLLPIQVETVAPLEVIPIDHGELRLAPEGSRPGLTGKTELIHEEAMLHSALQGNLLSGRSYLETPGQPARQFFARIEPDPVERGFGHDLCASFYCAGYMRNALNLLPIAVVCALFGLLLAVLPGMLRILVGPVLFALAIFVVQFLWATLRRTAFGEDRIPIVASENDVWHDGIKPLFWLLVVSGVCTVPAWLLNTVGGGLAATNPLLIWLALAGGWFLWPVAIMSVGLGNSIVLLRPDYLVRCVAALGTAYFFAWGVVLIATAGWVVLDVVGRNWVWTPVVSYGVQAYFGYVLFRTLGLLYRHFHTRFPWRF